jgi:transposase InsO family protein
MRYEAPPEVKFRIIRDMTARDSNLLNITWLCKYAGVSRSGYYNWLDKEPLRLERDAKDKADFELILAAYRFRCYAKGARGIYMRLLHQAPSVVFNIKKIRRLMHKFNLRCPIRRANPYRRIAAALKTSNVAPDLLQRQFRAYGPRMVLLTDITYLVYNSGQKSYLCTILDAYTKQVLSYVASDSLEVDFVLETVTLMIEKHGVSLQAETLINSDQGAHYTSYRFIQLITDNNLRQSMSRKANCWDNAPQESFFGHMKDEIDIRGCRTHRDLCVVIEDWMEYYNNDRYQWDLARLSPNEYEKYINTGEYPLSVMPPRNLGASPQTPGI